MSFHEDEILGKAYDARLMRRLLEYLRPYRTQVVLAIAAIIGHSILELAPPYLTKLVIDRYIPAGDLSGLGLLALFFLLTLVGTFVLEYVQTWTMQITGQRIMFDLRMQIYTHLQRLDLRFYDRNPVGRLMTRVTTDVDVLNELFTAGVVSVFGDVFTLIGIMAVLVWMDWRLALIAFSVLPLIFLITQWFRSHVRESYRTVRIWIARINVYLQERITGMATVQLFRREERDFAEFDEIDRRHRDANVDSIFYYAVFYPAVELVSALAASLIIWIGGGWVIEDTLTLGSLVAFFQYSQRFFRPISDMSEKFNILQGAMASSERIFTLLDTPVEISSPRGPQGSAPHLQGESVPDLQGESVPDLQGRSVPDLQGRSVPDLQGKSVPDLQGESVSDLQGKSVPDLQGKSVPDLQAGSVLHPESGAGLYGPPQGPGAIAFEHVTFAYVEGEPVLKDVSFRVEPGQRVAIVGATGSGKTTIVSLLSAVLRRAGGTHHDRRRRPPRHGSWDAAGLLRPRAAGRAPVFRYGRGQHPPRQ